MRLNWMNYRFWNYDGYGRYGAHFVRALARLGVNVMPMVTECVTELPGWMQRMAGYDFTGLSIGCMPPYCLPHLPGRVWSLTMSEGTRLSAGWATHLNCKAERVIVPCEHNRRAFVDSGVTIPVHVVPGGTSPEEFPLLERRQDRPYTILALADRGARKGWVEVWDAFYKAFGTPAQTPNVRLVIKTRPHTNDLVERIMGASGLDRRVSFWTQSVDSMADVYAQVDCFAFPSHSEGWGMPPREAAMSGLPVIVTRYSGLDDGHTQDWSAVVLERNRIEKVPEAYAAALAGEWCRADVDELTEALRWCYDHQDEAHARGRAGAAWLRGNQTWEHAARQMITLIEEQG
jgi:glycosyltransferase involved in cell wall biosynthesis